MDPSQHTTVTFVPRPVRRRFSQASCASAGMISTDTTRAASAPSTAAAYPLPAPTSSTVWVPVNSSDSAISAVMYGCEMVCPWPM